MTDKLEEQLRREFDRRRHELAEHEDVRTGTIGRHVVRLLERGAELSIEALEAELKRSVSDINEEGIKRLAAEKALAYLSDMSPRSSPGN